MVLGVAAAMFTAVAALVIFTDPTPVAESAVSAARVEPRLDSHVNFIDRFGQMDATRWEISDGWHNGSWVENDWRRDQVSVGPRGLTLTLAPNGGGREKPYSSGEIVTSEAFQYGYYEARMRVPRGDGVVTGFFTFTRPGGVRTWQEIDMEIVGRNTRALELAYHVGGRPRKYVVDLGFDAADGFHTYAFDWRPDVIRFYVDNKLVWEATGSRVEAMTAPQRFIINLWNTEELHRWTGRVQPQEAPWRLHVSCVAQAREYRGQSLCASGA